MSKRELAPQPAKFPSSIRALCGDPPVLSYEKRKDYETLLGAIAECVKPTDVIEWLWLKDVVDHTWEIRRLRRLKQQLIEIGSPQPKGPDRFAHLVSVYKDENKPPPEQPKKPRRKPASTKDVVEAFRQAIDHYHAVDRLLISAEDRRNAVLKEIDRRREGLAQCSRRASDDVIDAEFSESTVTTQ